MAKRRAKPKPKARATGTPTWLRGEAAGSLLVVLALVTLLSLLSSNRGNITGAMIDGMRAAFGAGVWFMPILLAALGLWLILRGVSDQQRIPGARIVAGLGLFLVIEATVHIMAGGEDPLALSQSGDGGGLTGYLISQALVVTLGFPAAVAMLLLAGAIALIALVGITPLQVHAAIAGAWARLRGIFEPPDTLPISPTLPLETREPLWRRWRRRIEDWISPPSRPIPLSGIDEHPRGPLIVHPPLQSARSGPEARQAGPLLRGMGQATGKGTAGPVAPAQAAEPAPRIIGSGGQSWRLPMLSDILEESTELDIQGDDLRQRAAIIEKTLEGFGVPVQVVEANQGPAVTQFGLRPGTIVRRNRKGEDTHVKVRVSQIQALSNDLALALAASPIRIEAPVPGRDVVGVEVPNVQTAMVSLRSVMESEEYRLGHGDLRFGLGRDVSGQAAIADMARMPHLLIAGATGSGKSVCVNSIVTALLLKNTPETLRLLMIDPKRVELTVYNGIPHLVAPVVVDVERAVPVLQWATREMDRRYRLFAKMSARNIEGYNEKVATRGEQILPYIVIFIDELADLMLSAPEDCERYICRIAQMARATGIHMVIATQRPSVDVVTGLIKANFPARIAFAVTSQIDSRVILDTPGAEQLLGRGDMLFMAPDASKLHRLQGCRVSDRETQRLVQYWKGVHTLSMRPATGDAQDAGTQEAEDEGEESDGPAGGALDVPWLPGQETLQQPLWPEMAAMEQSNPDQDGMYRQAEEEVRKAGRASVSLLQRRLRIGYSRAARLIDELEENGVIGPDQGGSRGREVLPQSGSKDA